MITTQQEKDKLNIFEDTNFDNFNRFRVSTPYTLLDCHFVRDSNDVQTTFKTIGTGANVREQNRQILTVSTAGDSVTLQTRNRATYQPGKSLLVMMTGVMNYDNNSADCISKIGYYDDDDGYYFQYSNGIWSVVERSSSSGSFVENVINKDDWNDNPNINIKADKTLIFIISHAWLGVGAVRMSVMIGRKIYNLHTFKHSNILNIPYTNTASQVCRYELSGTSGKMLCNCMTVISEGGFNVVGRAYSIDNHFTAKTLGASLIPLLSLRIKAGSKINAIVENIGLVALSNNATIHFELFIVRDDDGTALTGEVWQDVGPGSDMEYDETATALTATGAILNGYLGRNAGNLDLQTKNYNNLNITKNINGVSDILIFAAGSLSGTESVVSSIFFKEVI